MTEQQREALAELRLDTTLTQENVWNSTQAHVAGLHLEAQRVLTRSLKDARDSTGSSPTGVVLNGRSGAGKTHLLGWFRQQVRREGGYFFLSNLNDSAGFWPKMVETLQSGLAQDGEDGLSQLDTFLRRLATATGLSPALTDAVTGVVRLTPDTLDELVGAIKRLDRRVGTECQDAARALALTASPNVRDANVGADYLTSSDEMAPGDRAKWGFRAQPHEPRRVVADVSKLLALTGPSIIAVDQIDTLVTLSTKATTAISGSSDSDTVDQRIALISDGLMLLREETRRTVTVVACLPQSWDLIKHKAVNSVPDRFTETPPLSRIPEARIGQELVEAWLARTYDRIGFEPPYPTWPVIPSAFDDVKQLTPRALLNRIGKHVDTCLRGGEVRELASFTEDAVEALPLSGELSGQLSLPSGEDLDRFDARFEELKLAADATAPLDPAEENGLMPLLLSAGLTAWIAEHGPALSWSVDPPQVGKVAPLHARLRQTIDEELEDEEHWSFRAVGNPNGTAAASRLKKAVEASGCRLGVTGRRLVLIRNIPWSKGVATRKRLDDVEAAGGCSVPITEDDLRTFSALRQMFEEHRPGLYDWLDDRRPASGTELFTTVLPRPVVEAPEAVVAREVPEPVVEPQPDEVPMVPIGVLVADGASVRVKLESLRKHVVVFAGPGSGKTVLLRRIVEESALLGVSSIVLDMNNDLALLGDPWPEPSDLWFDGDEVKARKYLSDTDVVIWTPGRANGRPLTFPPLPDFAGASDDADEFEFAVSAAVASLTPSAGVGGNSRKAKLGRAVLKETVTYFGRSGGRSLDALIGVLTDLPDGVCELSGAAMFAAEIAESLRAARINDPFLRETDHPVDPGMLLTPPPDKTARVSVISLDGLPSMKEKQGFVNQLQMELFAWVKRHPARDRPLGGLLVMDEAHELAPSAGSTPSTESSIRLATQARKYGLGLVLATQSPKAVHNRISGSATTQFFGLLSHSTHIDAARNLARNKGRDLYDLGRMPPGEFYVTGEGIAFQKVRVPMSLSHHPRGPLTTEEVLDRARRT
ncbi:helicase HerA domain-containing protein [Amycolatopsis sp. H20-H5]|uniref:helicase HerA domain-containing protein n=1 Tax=Amycolatopsis sp. H20-H5 TaxID=3046309 RepID=UPI002DB8B2BD|nr:DUF87 domain-containing protein [Amycolatopsis sp. H20-H5]MEC3974098.1 DUF87 domain-containing protein [Amycolatopsis sp. H20-H5]